jgi:hypothetical protein
VRAGVKAVSIFFGIVIAAVLVYSAVVVFIALL